MYYWAQFFKPNFWPSPIKNSGRTADYNWLHHLYFNDLFTKKFSCSRFCFWKCWDPFQKELVKTTEPQPLWRLFFAELQKYPVHKFMHFVRRVQLTCCGQLTKLSTACWIITTYVTGSVLNLFEVTYFGDDLCGSLSHNKLDEFIRTSLNFENHAKRTCNILHYMGTAVNLLRKNCSRILLLSGCISDPLLPPSKETANFTFKIKNFFKNSNDI